MLACLVGRASALLHTMRQLHTWAPPMPERKKFVAMLATKRSAGAAPAVNLRYSLNAGNKGSKQEDLLY